MYVYIYIYVYLYIHTYIYIYAYSYTYVEQVMEIGDGQVWLEVTDTNAAALSLYKQRGYAIVSETQVPYIESQLASRDELPGLMWYKFGHVAPMILGNSGKMNTA